MQCKCNANAQNDNAKAMQTECKSNAIKEKEIKEKEIKEEIPHTQCARNVQEEFFEELGNMQIAWEEISMKFRENIPTLKNLFNEFRLECRAKGTEHTSVADLRYHFVDWARIQIQQQKKQQQYESRYKSASERKREANDIAIKRCQASVYERLTNVGREEQLPI